MAFLQFFDCLPDLDHLVRLGHFAVTLQVDTRISRPGRLEYVVTARNPRFSEITATLLQRSLKLMLRVLSRMSVFLLMLE
jgi:hypothetical protein